MTENNTNNTNNTNNENGGNAINLNELLRRIGLFGLGAVTLTVEKSRELAALLIRKGEKTAEDKNINCDTVCDQVADTLRDMAKKVDTELRKADFEDLLSRLDELNDEQRAIARERIDNPLPTDEDEPVSCDEPDCGACDKAADCPIRPDDAPEADAPETEKTTDSDDQ